MFRLEYFFTVYTCCTGSYPTATGLELLPTMYLSLLDPPMKPTRPVPASANRTTSSGSKETRDSRDYINKVETYYR